MYPAHQAISKILILLVSVSGYAFSAHAQQVKPFATDKPVVSQKKPVLLEAERVEYDQKEDLVLAIGNVEISQAETVILADKLVYDLKANRVMAKGNISMLQPSGDVLFADEVELQDDLREGVIRQFSARLVDNSLFVARSAKKLDQDRIELFKAAYTPCACEEDGKSKSPLWQLNADHVMVDQEAQKVRYENAYFEVFDFPVLYTPYFSHATPGADNKSGLLMPTFLQSQNLGAIYRQPVYYSIAKDKDVTITPVYQSIAGPLVMGEYRQMFDNGQMLLEGSVTSAQNRDPSGNYAPGRETRGHYVAKGDFRFDEHYNWGFDLRRASDPTYLRLYNISNDILLTSRGYVEGIDFVEGNDRSYASVQGLSFQGLTGRDNRSVIPLVLPLASVSYQSNPGIYNSRISLSGNAMSLFREDGNESRRLSAAIGWKLPYITDDGQVIEFRAHMRSDAYYVNNINLPNGSLYDGITGRHVPTVSLNWRYPFIREFASGSSLLIEPIVEVNASPNGGNPSKIPNEDSLFPEFTDTNLFATNRYPGLDRVESGLRSSYALRALARVQEATYIDMLFGQHWRLEDDPSFPYSTDLSGHASDYVGKLGILSDPFTLAYRFRLDKDDFQVHRNEIDMAINLYPATISAAYLSIERDPILAAKQVIAAQSSINITKNWSWIVTGSHDLQLDQIDTVYSGVAYKDECANLTFMVGKDYTNLRDIRPATTAWIKISLKNLE